MIVSIPFLFNPGLAVVIDSLPLPLAERPVNEQAAKTSCLKTKGSKFLANSLRFFLNSSNLKSAFNSRASTKTPLP